MRILSRKVAVTVCVSALTLSTLAALHGADLQNGSMWPREIKAEPAEVICAENHGLPATSRPRATDRGTAGPLCCLHHPTAIYHPEIYNYRYVFNIVGYEAYSRYPNYRNIPRTMNRPEEILTPVPEQQTQSGAGGRFCAIARAGTKKIPEIIKLAAYSSLTRVLICRQ